MSNSAAMRAGIAISSRRDHEGDTASAVTTVSAARLVGYLCILVLVAGFGLWAATAPIAGSVIAHGQISSQARNQSVQHLEGGIVAGIHVDEGERVAAGQPIVTIDDSRARSAVVRLERQLVGLQAQLARLQAERSMAETFTLPEALTEAARRLEVTEVVVEQAEEFAARRAGLAVEKSILLQRVAALEQSITGFQTQVDAIQEQLDILEPEIERKRDAVERGIAVRDEFTELVRVNAQLVGQRGAALSDIARTRTEIAETREQIVRLDTAVAEEASGEISTLRAELADLDEQLREARSVLDRTVVRSPVDGLVIQLATRTIGAVVAPGGDLATVLPTDADLIVSARVMTGDIDLVSVGQQAELQLVALNQRLTPTVAAEVIYLSPDALAGAEGEPNYYAARLRIGALPASVRPDQIYAGMPVTVLIATPERTFFDYILRPVLDSLRLAFREE